MAARIEMNLRVQYETKDGEWKTIIPEGEDALVITGDIVAALARWVEWFEEQEDFGGELCPACLQRLNEVGHADDCVYSESKVLLDDWNDEE